MLTPQFIKARERDLLKEKQRLEGEIARRRKFEEFGTSEDDNAQEVQSFEENLSIRTNSEQLLGEVRGALQKIEQGTYGTCAMGPEEIEKERLEAFPAASVCMKHKQELDRQQAGRWWKPWTWRR